MARAFGGVAYQVATLEQLITLLSLAKRLPPARQVSYYKWANVSLGLCVASVCHGEEEESLPVKLLLKEEIYNLCFALVQQSKMYFF